MSVRLDLSQIFLHPNLFIGVLLCELPLASLSWIKDTIVNGFWRLPSAGGLRKDKHTISATFDGEEILVGRIMNAGDEGSPPWQHGF